MTYKIQKVEKQIGTEGVVTKVAPSSNRRHQIKRSIYGRTEGVIAKVVPSLTQ